MKLFLLCVAALPLAAFAGDEGAGYYGLTLPNGKSLAVELRANNWGESLNAKPLIAPQGAVSGLQDGFGSLDPNTPAMQVMRRAAIEKFTSVGSNKWRYSMSLSKPSIRIRYVANQRDFESYKFEVKRDPLSGTWIRFSYERLF